MDLDSVSTGNLAVIYLGKVPVQHHLRPPILENPVLAVFQPHKPFRQHGDPIAFSHNLVLTKSLWGRPYPVNILHYLHQALVRYASLGLFLSSFSFNCFAMSQPLPCFFLFSAGSKAKNLLVCLPACGVSSDIIRSMLWYHHFNKLPFHRRRSHACDKLLLEN